MIPLRSLSRRAAMVRLGGGGLAAALAVRGAATAAAQECHSRGDRGRRSPAR